MKPTREERLNRTALLFDDEQMHRLKNTHVMLFGLGGVGSYAAEALARSGLGKLTIVDFDRVTASNMNRQLPALASTLGRLKTDVMRERLMDAAPDLELVALNAMYLPEAPVPIPADCAYVADAIDNVSAKIHLIQTCQSLNVPILSCMGMGNRLDPSLIRVGELFDTSGCPLCRVMRRELRRRGYTSLRCVYSVEEARTPRFAPDSEARPGGRAAPGSVSFVPSVAGLLMAYEIVSAICAPQPSPDAKPSAES